MDDFLVFDDSAFRELARELGEQVLRETSETLAEAASDVFRDSGGDEGDREGYADSYYVMPAGEGGAVVANDHPSASEIELGSSTTAPLSPMMRALYEMEGDTGNP